MKISHMLLQKGHKFRSLGVVFCITGLASLGLLLLLCFCALVLEGIEAIPELLSFAIYEDYSFVILPLLLSYLGILIGACGPAIYFHGLHLLGLGQIALNTDSV